MGLHTLLFVFAIVALQAASAGAQSASGSSDVYHVMFVKALPGQAAAMGKALIVPDPKAPMSDHFVVLRHQEGDDWDFCVIQHLGPKAAIDPAPTTSPIREMRAWHNDTFVAGPSWPEFTRAMGIDGANASKTGNAVYTVGVFQALSGHREDLLKTLSAGNPNAKVQTGVVALSHIEGGQWTFLVATRYNSWQDLATDRASAAGAIGSSLDGWAETRKHISFHRDTVADRLFPR